MTMTATFAMADGAIKIGEIGPLTGAAAIYGTAVANGAQIAIDELNALGGQQYELNAQDDEGDAEKAINAYNALMDWGMQMMAGTVTTTPCTAVAAQAYEERLFMLTPSASSPVVTEGKDNVFRICFSDPDQGSASAQYIAEKKLAQKVAVIYNNSDSYSTGIYQVFEAKANIQAHGREDSPYGQPLDFWKEFLGLEGLLSDIPGDLKHPDVFQE